MEAISHLEKRFVQTPAIPSTSKAASNTREAALATFSDSEDDIQTFLPRHQSTVSQASNPDAEEAEPCVTPTRRSRKRSLLEIGREINWPRIGLSRKKYPNFCVNLTSVLIILIELDGVNEKKINK